MTPAWGQALLASQWRFASPGLLLWLTAVPIAGVLLWLALARQRRALAAFAGVTPQGTSPSRGRALAKVLLLCLGMTMGLLGIARPQSDPVEEDATLRGRDIVFLVDVSRSMLARDAVPNRLERAKLWIKDLAGTRHSDRVALVAFAGVPVVKCPLTMDAPFFRMALDELSPASSPRGGTMIGDAIRKALSDVFEPGPARYRDIILITDGEDQGSFPVEAAKKAGEMGVRIIALGIGGELEGSLVPTGDGAGFMSQNGQQVRSRLDSATLAQITQAAAQARGDAGGGVFLNVGTGTIDLEKVYADLIAGAEQRETRTKAAVSYRELFQYFLGLAFVVLLVEPVIGHRPRHQARRPLEVVPGRASVAAAALAGFVIIAAPIARGAPPAPPAAPVPAPDAPGAYNAGRELFLAGKYAEAAESFRIADRASNDPELSALARFNLGQSLLKIATGEGKAEPAQTLEQLDAAARAFRSVLAVRPDDAQAARNVEIARRLMQDIKDKQQQQQPQQGKDGSKQEQGKEAQHGQPSGGDSSNDPQHSQQHQENADKLKDLAQRQQQAAEASKQAQQDQDPAQRQAGQRDSQAKQDQVSQDTQKEQERQGDPKSAASPQAKDKLDQARKEQQAASRALDQGDAKSAEQHQREAAKLLEQAAQEEQRESQEAQQESQQAQGKDAKPKDDSPPRDQTAAQWLDRERRQREARQQVLRALRGRPQTVEKDW